MIHLIAIRDWLKKHWKTIVLAVAFPIGILVLLSKFFRPKVVVTSPELLEHANLERKLHEETERKKEEATGRRDARNEKIVTEYDAAVAKAQKEAADRVGALRTDPEALNDFLKQVGRDARSK